MRIGDLEVLCAGNPAKPPLVLFHGYGASAQDLYALHRIAPDDFSWIFPNGPLSVGMCGRAWFPLDIEMLCAAQSSFAIFEHHFPQEWPATHASLKTFIEALNVPPEQLILGGFSQGAMIATDLSLSFTQNVRALLILSGTLIHTERWKPLARQHAGTPFFQSHGSRDAILPLCYAQKLYDLLTEAQWKGKFHLFSGGHQIPPSTSEQLRLFLKNCEFTQKAE